MNGGIDLNQQVQIIDGAERERIATRVSLVGIIGNVVLTAFKLLAGIIAKSGAMVSDAIHSASDVLATAIVMISMKFATKGADGEHPYGHERFECIASLLLSFILCVAGAGIGLSGIRKVIGLEEAVIPGKLALIAAAVSIVVKEAMYWYTIKAARKINSSALTANALDHRSDAFSSVGSFAGILGAILGFAKLDAIASLVIACFILRVAYTIFRDAVEKMVDKACDDEYVDKLRDCIAQTEQVLAIDRVSTRLFGDRVYVDVEVSMDKDLTLYDAHAYGHDIHDRIEEQYPEVKHCMVHINPYPANDQH